MIMIMIMAYLIVTYKLSAYPRKIMLRLTGTLVVFIKIKHASITTCILVDE